MCVCVCVRERERERERERTMPFSAGSEKKIIKINTKRLTSLITLFVKSERLKITFNHTNK